MSYRFALAASLFAISAGGFASTCSAAKLGDVEHIIVIYLENHSFDNLFGFFPGADGIATAGATKIQVDADGKPYSLLPQVNETADKVDSRFPKDLPNQPFSIDAYVPIGAVTGDPIHRFFYQQAQIDGGRMDKFVAYTNMGALVMGFYDGSANQALGIRAALHARRSFLPRSLRRLVPQSFLDDLRLHAHLQGRAGKPQGGA